MIRRLRSRSGLLGRGRSSSLSRGLASRALGARVVPKDINFRAQNNILFGQRFLRGTELKFVDPIDL